MPDGKKGEYNVVVSPPSVYIVAVNEQKQIALVKLFRYTTQRWSVEVPAGNSDGQRRLVAAKRELQEEAGVKAKTWKKIGEYQITPGLMSEIGHVYLAKNLSFTLDNKQAEEGIEQVIWVSYSKALTMIQKGEISDAHTIVALSLSRPYF